MESDVISALPGCYLLVILGEPLSDDHNEKILQRVAKGLLSWNTESTQCDLKHLEHVCDSFKIDKQEAFETEILLQHATDRLAVEVLFNPHIFTFKQCLRNLLLSPTGHKHIIYAGYSFNGTGSWILQDGIFRFNDFLDELCDPSVIKVHSTGSTAEMHLHCQPIGDWIINKLDDQPFSHLINLSLNPSDSPNGVPGASHLLEFIETSLKALSKKDSLESSSLTGNIKFERPTIYIFPSGQGDCSLLGITGFTMLIDGGFPRFPCFWKFIRHIETLDTIMITRINESNVWGILSLLKGKQECCMFPKIGYVFCNIGGGSENEASIKEGNEITSIKSDKDDLIISLTDMGKEVASRLKQINCNPHQCIRESTLKPLILYQKVGHGTLEMYVLNPSQESKLLKEFLSHWSSNKDSLPVVRTRSALQNREKSDQDIAIPVSDLMSICCLIVWKPSDPLDRITRILFPGSAPQNQIMEGLAMLKGLELLNSRACTIASLQHQPKHKTTRTSVNKSETSVSSTRYRSVSPTNRKSRTKQIATNDSLERGKGRSESQSSTIKRKENIYKLQKEDNFNEKTEKTFGADKKITKSTNDRKARTKDNTINQPPPAKIVTESSEIASDVPEKQSKSTAKRQVRRRASDKVQKVSTKKENTYDCYSVDEKTDTFEVYNKDNPPDSIKGSEGTSPQKFPFNVRDEVEPDSLESYEIYGNVEISQDSLEHSEDGVITCDSHSTSQMDQVISIEENDIKSWSSPIDPNDNLQSNMISSLSSNISEMTMISGERKDSQTDLLEVSSLKLRIDSDRTSSSTDNSLTEENHRKSKNAVEANMITANNPQTLDNNANDNPISISTTPSNADVVKPESDASKNKESKENESYTQNGPFGANISQKECSKEVNQFAEECELLESQANLLPGLCEDSTVEDKMFSESQTRKCPPFVREMCSEDKDSVKLTVNDATNEIETNAQDEIITEETVLDDALSTVTNTSSDRLQENIQGNRNILIVGLEGGNSLETKSAESSNLIPEEKETAASEFLQNESFIVSMDSKAEITSKVKEKEMKNCDTEDERKAEDCNVEPLSLESEVKICKIDLNAATTDVDENNCLSLSTNEVEEMVNTKATDKDKSSLDNINTLQEGESQQTVAQSKDMLCEEVLSHSNHVHEKKHEDKKTDEVEESIVSLEKSAQENSKLSESEAIALECSPTDEELAIDNDKKSGAIKEDKKVLKTSEVTLEEKKVDETKKTATIIRIADVNGKTIHSLEVLSLDSEVSESSGFKKTLADDKTTITTITNDEETAVVKQEKKVETHIHTDVEKKVDETRSPDVISDVEEKLIVNLEKDAKANAGFYGLTNILKSLPADDDETNTKERQSEGIKEEREIQNHDIDVDGKQRVDAANVSSAFDIMTKKSERITEAPVMTNNEKLIVEQRVDAENVSSVADKIKSNNLSDNIQDCTETTGQQASDEVMSRSVHFDRSTQRVGQILYEELDKEAKFDESFSEKKQIELCHEKTNSKEYPEVLHIKESPSSSFQVSGNSFLGRTDTASTSSTETDEMLSENTQSRSCCFPVSIEVEETENSAEKPKELTCYSGLSDTFNSQNLNEQQTKCKEATLKEWGNPLGLPKPPVYKASESTLKSRAKSSDRNENSKHTVLRSTHCLDSVKPIYLDLAYIPHHGDKHYCNADYFKKIRARYYVLSGVNPSKEVLDALIIGKQSWTDKGVETTLIPSHESEELCLWMATNQKTLEILNIDVAPSASRCSVILQGQESSCSAYRVEF